MGCQIGSIRVLHQKLVRASYGSAETKKKGAILEGQRNTEVYLSATRPFECLVFFPLSAHAMETSSV